MSKEIKKIKSKIDKLLENKLLTPAVGLAEYDIRKRTYTNEDWENYEKETGNPRVTYQPPKNSLESEIDKQTGYLEQQRIAYSKFLLWNIEQFKKGMEEDE